MVLPPNRRPRQIPHAAAATEGEPPPLPPARHTRSVTRWRVGIRGWARAATGVAPPRKFWTPKSV